jgi:hypothetical protein
VRALNEDLILDRSMGLDARVMDALVMIREDPKYSKFLLEGEFEGFGKVNYTYTKFVSAVANELMDEMNIAEGQEGEDESKKRKPRGTTSQTVGSIARRTLMLPCKRLTKGYVIIYIQGKMDALKFKYGLTRKKGVPEWDGYTLPPRDGGDSYEPHEPETPESGQESFAM